MSNKIYLIGNKNEYASYLNNLDDVDFLPIKNLPITYFPFYYNNNEISTEKIKKLVPILQNYSTTNNVNDIYNNGKSVDVNMEKLFTLLTNIEEDYQPYNNNNIYHIRVVIILFWVLAILYILKIFYHLLSDKYTYFIGGLVILLLIISIIWGFVITNQYL